MVNPYVDNTPFHIWVPTDLSDSEIDELLTISGEVHKAICNIHRNDIDIWEGLELLETIVPNMDDYLKYVESNL